jgi:hypothetical protein
VRRRLAQAPGDQHAHRNVGEAAREVGDPPQGRAVGPVRVVDADEHGAVPAEVGEEPEERVPGRVGGLERIGSRLRSAREPEHRPAGAAGPSSSLRRLGAATADSADSKSWRTIPYPKPSSSAPPRAENSVSPRSAASRMASSSSAVLPMPASPSMSTSRPGPARASFNARPSSARSSVRSSSSSLSKLGS